MPTKDEIKKLKHELYEVIAHHTHKEVEVVAKDCDRDFWMTASEAKEYGFVDHVVRSAGQVSGSGGTA